jgi:hypothetical protein
VFLALRSLHVLAGITAVLTTEITALARKGTPRHIRAGRSYYRAITVISTTATILAAMRWRQDSYLFILGVVAFAAATVGYQRRRRHRPGDTGHIAGMGFAYVTMLTAFYIDNGPRLPLWGPATHTDLLAAALCHRSTDHARAIIRARHIHGSPAQRTG